MQITDKELELNNAWKITLKDNKGIDYVQFIEADCMDSAIKKAKNTFQARLYSLCDKNKGSEAQKACDKTLEHNRLLFDFRGGHITIEAHGTIYDMFKLAKNHSFVAGLAITGVTSEMHYNLT